MTTTALLQDISIVNTDHCLPNDFNPNVMDEETFQSLVDDFVNGRHVEPIIIIDHPTVKGKYLIVNGEKRWKACIKAGKKMIEARIRIMTLDEARVFCYKDSKIRGTIDPVKEAHFFEFELNKGLKQKEIAAKYSISEQQVSERMRLLSIEEPELKAFQEAINPSTDNTKAHETGKSTRVEKPSPSQLEVLAGVPKPAREAFITAVKEEFEYEGATVEGLQDVADGIKGDYEKLVKLQKIVDDTQFKTCPTCGKPPRREAYAPDVLECPDFHAWNAKTGDVTDPWGHKLSKEDADEDKKEVQAETKDLNARKTAVFRLKNPRKEIRVLLVARIKKLVPTFDDITSCRVYGTKNGKGFELSLDPSPYLGLGFLEGNVGFSLEDKAYRTGEKTKVNCGSATRIPKVQKYIQALLEGKEWVPTKDDLKELDDAGADDEIQEAKGDDEEKSLKELQDDVKRNLERLNSKNGKDEDPVVKKTVDQVTVDSVAKVTAEEELQDAIGEPDPEDPEAPEES